MEALPRYFTPDAEARPTPLTPTSPLAILDAFLLSGPHAPGGDGAVLLDGRGSLTLALRPTSSSLPPALHQTLQSLRLVGTERSLDVASLHLFAFDRLSRSPDVPGLNDPVLLHGTLFGPFPGPSPSACPGVLTVTRADVLDAFLRGLGLSLRTTSSDERQSAGRWLHLHLPAGEIQQHERGEGTVLAFALDRGVTRPPEGGNVELTLSLLQELLEATRKDPAAEGLPLASARVPTASRDAVEVALEARGFAIEGDVAVRDGPGFWGALVPQRVPLPPQGTLVDFAQAALRSLSAMRDWPNPRVRAVRERMRMDRAAWVAGEPIGLVPVQEAAHGRFEDEGSVLVSRAPASSWSLNAEKRLKATWRAIHFRVDPAFATWNSGRMDLEVELSAEAPGDLLAESEHAGTPYPAEGHARLEAGDAWQVHRLIFGNAIFVGGFPGGAGFRVCFQSPGAVRLRRVTLRPHAALPRIEPKAVTMPSELVTPAEGGRLEVPQIRHQVGCAYVVAGPFGAAGDCSESPRQSPVVLYENGVALGPKHIGHHLIREQGAGQYSHWGDSLLFSSSDNSDPRTNGRVYTWKRA